MPAPAKLLGISESHLYALKRNSIRAGPSPAWAMLPLSGVRAYGMGGGRLSSLRKMASDARGPAMNKTKWPAATRENPCPKCGKVNRCRIAPDGRAGICWRSGSSEIWRDSRAAANGNGQHIRVDLPRTRPRPTYIGADAAIEAAGKSIKGGKLVGAWTYPGDVARVARFSLEGGDKEFRPVHRLDNGGVGHRRSAGIVAVVSW